MAKKKAAHSSKANALGPKPSERGDAAASAIYQLKVTLEDSDPAIWRRVRVPSNYTLSDLHIVIQRVMGWDNSHLHKFEIGKRIFVEEGETDLHGDTTEREDRVKLREAVPGAGCRFLYEYDFGDSWYHAIEVEAAMPREPGESYPACIAGERAAPPEDCGGLAGYYRLLDQLADPEHPDHEDMLDWAGEPIDPEAFDLNAINARLDAIRNR